MAQNSTSKKKGKNYAKCARNQKIMVDAANGATSKDIQEKYNLSREQVSRILNSDEMKAIAKRGESEVFQMLDQAIAVLKQSLTSVDEKLRADIAVRIAKSVGALKEKVDISHSFPKPTVIENLEGGETILGVKGEDEE